MVINANPEILTNPIPSMGLVYLPTFLVELYGKLVGKYISPKDNMGTQQKYPQPHNISWDRYIYLYLHLPYNMFYHSCKVNIPQKNTCHTWIHMSLEIQHWLRIWLDLLPLTLAKRRQEDETLTHFSVVFCNVFELFKKYVPKKSMHIFFLDGFFMSVGQTRD